VGLTRNELFYSIHLPSGVSVRRNFTLAIKPKALREGATIAIVSPSSPADPTRLQSGMAELRSLGFRIEPSPQMQPQGYFAGAHPERVKQLASAFQNKQVDGLIASRGGFGSTYLFDRSLKFAAKHPKCLVGYSDLTAVQIFLWQTRRWLTFYGPMVASDFAPTEGSAFFYDRSSFLLAVQSTKKGWNLSLQGSLINKGSAKGRLLGGCLTLLESTLGTPWELDTRNSILLLEDRGMKPYQVDRALTHLRQAGKFAGVRGIILGDFPECEPSAVGGSTTRDVCERILAPLHIPIVYGAPVGHTNRPILTVPLGVKACLQAKGEGTLEILEPAVVD
jgi:muramoyltetrapeptide carboxypeptidase